MTFSVQNEETGDQVSFEIVEESRETTVKSSADEIESEVSNEVIQQVQLQSESSAEVEILDDFEEQQEIVYSSELKVEQDERESVEHVITDVETIETSIDLIASGRNASVEQENCVNEKEVISSETILTKPHDVVSEIVSDSIEEVQVDGKTEIVTSEIIEDFSGDQPISNILQSVVDETKNETVEISLSSETDNEQRIEMQVDDKYVIESEQIDVFEKESTEEITIHTKQEEVVKHELEITEETESNKISIEVAAEEKETDIDVALSESEASQSDVNIELDILESDKSEVDFLVDTTEDSDFTQTSEVKLSITQESEDADMSMEIKEEDFENAEELSVEGKCYFY